MSRRMISTTVYLNPPQMEALRKLSERTRVPMATYIREGLDLLLDRYAKPLEVVQAQLDRYPAPPQMHIVGGEEDE